MQQLPLTIPEILVLSLFPKWPLLLFWILKNDLFKQLQKVNNCHLISTQNFNSMHVFAEHLPPMSSYWLEMKIYFAKSLPIIIAYIHFSPKNTCQSTKCSEKTWTHENISIHNEVEHVVHFLCNALYKLTIIIIVIIIKYQLPQIEFNLFKNSFFIDVSFYIFRL